MSDLPIYKLERVFNAPKVLVWKAWSDPDLLARWYGPGVETIIHEFDLKEGGVWKNEMRFSGKDGSTMSDLSKMSFVEVIEGEKIVWHHASVDQDWNVAANQMMPDWPRLLLTTVTFVEADDGASTNVTLTQIPMDATDKEIACFTSMMAGMSNGWGSGYKIIDDILSESQV